MHCYQAIPPTRPAYVAHHHVVMSDPAYSWHSSATANAMTSASEAYRFGDAAQPPSYANSLVTHSVSPAVPRTGFAASGEVATVPPPPASSATAATATAAQLAYLETALRESEQRRQELDAELSSIRADNAELVLQKQRANASAIAADRRAIAASRTGGGPRPPAGPSPDDLRRARASGEAAAERAAATEIEQLRAALDEAQETIAALTRSGARTSGWFGMEVGSGLAAGSFAGGPGARLCGVRPDGPAAAAGLQHGDVLKEITATVVVKSAGDAETILSLVQPQSVVTVLVERLGREMELDVRAAAAPLAPSVPTSRSVGWSFGHPYLCCIAFG